MTEDNRLLLHFNNPSSSTNDISLLTFSFYRLFSHHSLRYCQTFQPPLIIIVRGNVGSGGLYRVSLLCANFHHPSDPSILVVYRQLHYLATSLSLLLSAILIPFPRLTCPCVTLFLLSSLAILLLLLLSWRYNPLLLYFHSPVAGIRLLVFEVSWSHTTTRHSR
jgi:hypothetical protein